MYLISFKKIGYAIVTREEASDFYRELKDLQSFEIGGTTYSNKELLDNFYFKEIKPILEKTMKKVFGLKYGFDILSIKENLDIDHLKEYMNVEDGWYYYAALNFLNKKDFYVKKEVNFQTLIHAINDLQQIKRMIDLKEKHIKYFFKKEECTEKVSFQKFEEEYIENMFGLKEIDSSKFLL